VQRGGEGDVALLGGGWRWRWWSGIADLGCLGWSMSTGIKRFWGEGGGGGTKCGEAAGGSEGATDV
jgi:hypothetical protein